MPKRNPNYRLLIDSVTQEFSPNEQKIVDVKDHVKSVLIEPPFTLEFDVTRTSQALQNEISLTIHGLGAQTRKRIYQDNMIPDRYRGIEFWAGYGTTVDREQPVDLGTQETADRSAQASQSFPLLFRGNIDRAWSEVDGVRIRTQVQGASGTFDAKNAVTRRTYAKGAAYRQILLDLISDLKAVRLGAVGNFKGALERGNTYKGSPLHSIKQIVHGQGGRFFIDNGRAYCLLPDEALPGNVTEISSRTGLMGIPRRENHFVTARMMFEPGILVGQRVYLNSARVPEHNGTYFVLGISHQGVISGSQSGEIITTASLSNYARVMTEVSFTS